MIRRIVALAFMGTLLWAALCQAGTQAVPPQKTQVDNRDAELREAVAAYVKEKTANLGYDVRLKRISINGNPKLPEGQLEYEVVAPQQWEGWGTVNMAVLVRQGDRVVSNTSARVEVEALTDMVVTLRELERGMVITGADVAVQKRDAASVLGGKFIGGIKDVVGKQVRTAIRANTVVRADQVEKVPLIKSGQMVTIVAENEVMKVSVAGKARSSGAEGDVILVQNLNSLKEIPARVINATTVQIGF